MKTFSIDNTGKWPMYPCASYGTSNCDVEKCLRRQSVQVNPYKKKAKGKDHFSKKIKGGMITRDRVSKIGTRHSALIVVRVDIILRSVEHFTHTYVRSRT